MTADRRRHRWTDEDVATMRQMKAEFRSDREIAALIGSTEGTVANFASKLTSARSFCQFCHALLRPKGQGRRPTFCSPACGKTYAWAYRENARRDARCRTCREPSYANGRALRYCSRRCAQRHWYLFSSGRFSLRIRDE